MLHSIPAKLESLPEAMAEVDEILKMAHQLQIAEGNSSTGKKYGLLIEGFDRLRQKLEQIPLLVERREFLMAADTIDDIALINRVWHGKQDAALQEWARSYRETAAARKLELKADRPAGNRLLGRMFFLAFQSVLRESQVGTTCRSSELLVPACEREHTAGQCLFGTSGIVRIASLFTATWKDI